MGRVVEGKVRHTISQCHAVNKKQRVAETIKKYYNTIQYFHFQLHLNLYKRNFKLNNYILFTSKQRPLLAGNINI